MTVRANWSGTLEIAGVKCPVKLFTAVSTSERLSLRTISRRSRNPLNRIMVDEDTGQQVTRDDQLKGYEFGQNLATFTSQEIEALVPIPEKVLKLNQFVSLSDVPVVAWAKPYYLAAANARSQQTFASVRQALEEQHCGAVASLVIFRRFRKFLIFAYGSGMVAMMLHFDYELRSAKTAFSKIGQGEVSGEMLDLAKRIIAAKRGDFKPAEFEDRYERALLAMVRAKAAGKPAPKLLKKRQVKPIKLLDALRQSAQAA